MSEDTVNVEVTVGDLDGKVFIGLDNPRRVLVLSPQEAHDMAERLARAGYEARFGKKPTVKSVLRENLQQMLTTRTLHIMRSLAEQKKAPALIASAVVDTILAEVM